MRQSLLKKCTRNIVNDYYQMELDHQYVAIIVCLGIYIDPPNSTLTLIDLESVQAVAEC